MPSVENSKAHLDHYIKLAFQLTQAIEMIDPMKKIVWKNVQRMNLCAKMD